MATNRSMFFFVFCTLATGSVAGSPVLTIPLVRQDVPVMRNNRTVMNKTAYFGNMFAGDAHIQSFTVVFDTGSGHLMLPSVRCQSETCAKHRQFDPGLSRSAMKPDKIEILYGTGEVKGDSMRERVCLGQFDANTHQNAPLCANLDMMLATEMTEQPFSALECDGVLGLGLQSLALSPSFSFLNRIASSMDHLEVPRMFAVFLSDDDSEISFGGYNEARTMSSLQWTPVNRPELGYWQVRIKSISIDAVPLPVCDDGTCVAILDSGTSSLGVPKPVLHDIHYKLVRPISHTMDDELAERTDCRDVAGPSLEFHLEGATLSLDASDYSRPAPFHAKANLLSSERDFVKNAQSTEDPQATFCRATLLPVQMDDPMPVKTFILGEPALRKYYTAYDWGEERVGFALASQPIKI